MAQHLGSEKDASLEIFEDKDHYTRNKLLFWSLFVQDRLLSLSTGRLCTVSLSLIKTNRADLIFTGSRRNGGTSSADRRRSHSSAITARNDCQSETGAICRPCQANGHRRENIVCAAYSAIDEATEQTAISRDLLNGNRGAAKTLGGPLDRDMPSRMQALQTELVQFYNELPENLVWSTTNFKFWVSEHKGGVSFVGIRCTSCADLRVSCRCFCLCIVWVSQAPYSCSGPALTPNSIANAVLALLYHPALLTPPNGADTPMSQGMQRSIKLSLTCARTICECMVLADWGSPISFVRHSLLGCISELKYPSADSKSADNASALRRRPRIRSRDAHVRVSTRLPSEPAIWTFGGLPSPCRQAEPRGNCERVEEVGNGMGRRRRDAVCFAEASSR
jgi:hypothetical protein